MIKRYEVLAIPKDSYIIKKSFEQELRNSKTPANVFERIKAHAEAFEKNNLKNSKDII